MIPNTGRRRCCRPQAGVCLIVAVIVALGSPSAGQQPVAPQTGAPRQQWPQRPGVFRPLDVTAFPAPVADVQPPAAVVDEPAFVPNEVLVQFEPDTPEATRAAARVAASAVLASTLRSNGRLERLTTSLAVADAMAILQTLPEVEFAEPNWIVRHQAASNDPEYTNGNLWGMYGDATTPSNPYGSQAGEAWAAGLTGAQSIYVGVIDEGIDVNHPDLAPNIWTNPFDPVDGIDNDGNGKVDDIHGWDFRDENNTVYDGVQDDHGTHVAGTIGARGGNGIGVAGVAWNVSIISGKFLGPSGGSNADAIEALDYLIDLKTRHGLNIIATNNSWSGGGYSTALHQAIIRAAKAGILFMAAAGNGGSDQVGDNNDVTPTYPANYSTTLPAGSETAANYEAVTAVAAITDSGLRSSFSNYGATGVDIGAPGSGVYSTLPQGGYGPMSGTSMATPHVTGAAVLYKAAHPSAAAAEIRSEILARGIQTPSLSGITVTGGRLNVGEFNLAFSLNISNASRSEGNSGTADAVFTVSLSGQSPFAVTVGYRTVDVSAAGGGGTNPATISVPSSGATSIYPSTITMPSNLGPITKASVVLHGFGHTWPSDVDVLLVGPAGQTCILMSDVGGSADVDNRTFSFDDSGPSMPVSGTLTSGTFRPTNNDTTTDSFPGAPAGPYGTSLSAFNGTSPAGEWRLYIVDDTTGDGGTVFGGWSLSLATTGRDYVSSSGIVTFAPGSTSQPLPISVVGDTMSEGDETFKVLLVDAAGATIADGEGIGTIVDDDVTTVISGAVIRAADIVNLRSAVNQARVARGLQPFSFDDALTPQSTLIRAVHLTQLRTAIKEGYAHANQTAPTFMDDPIVPGVTAVKAAHINELWAALAALP